MCSDCVNSIVRDHAIGLIGSSGTLDAEDPQVVEEVMNEFDITLSAARAAVAEAQRVLRRRSDEAMVEALLRVEAPRAAAAAAAEAEAAEAAQDAALNASEELREAEEFFVEAEEFFAPAARPAAAARPASGGGRSSPLMFLPQNIPGFLPSDVLARDLLVKMQRAARSDREQFKKHQPGLEKLKLVNEVIQALRDPDVARALLDQNVLGVLAGAAHEAGWIDVLPNGKLPSLSLRTKLLVEVAQLPVTKQVFILFLSIFLITLHYFHYE